MPLQRSASAGARTQGEGITDILMGPAKLRDTIPGISGTRNLSDNLSDLRAQVRVPHAQIKT
jgi:5-oxoprolinase (ATP-hydrolysing)